MKKWIILSMVLLTVTATILTGCNTEKGTDSQKTKITTNIEQTAKKEVILPKNLSSIWGKTYDELQKQKGVGEEEYTEGTTEKYLSAIKYNEQWFNWNEKVKATYIGNSPNEDKIIEVILNFPKGTNRDKLINQISTYLGEANENNGGEGSAYSAQWEKDDLSYYLEDYGYLEMYINKKQ